MAIEKIGYRLSREFCEAEYIRTGERPAEHQLLEIESTSLTPEQRRTMTRLLYSAGGRALANPEQIGLTRFGQLKPSLDNTDCWSELILAERVPAILAQLGERLAELDAEVEARTAEKLATEIATATAELKRLSAFSDEQVAAIQGHGSGVGGLVKLPGSAPAELHTALADLVQRAQAALAARDAAKAEAEDAAKVARLADRAAWIDEHGSEYLRKAVGAGYSCQRQYVTERVALELPGFAVDFADRVETKSRACPSERRLDESLALIAGGHQALVVWLTREPVEPVEPAEYDEPAEEREAIVIDGYLGRYTLVK